MQNLQSKTPYKFKKSYGGTPEPLPPEYPPFRRGPSLKVERNLSQAGTLGLWVLRCISFWELFVFFFLKV